MTTLSKALQNWNLGFVVPKSSLKFLKDPVVIALITGFIGLTIIDRPQVTPSFVFTVDALLGMAPFFLLAIGFAAYAKASGADALIARAFSGNPVKSIIIASLAGTLSPFCSCGVIPLIAAMLAAGVPLAPVLAFCISSPLMDPEMFIITAAGIGLNFTIAKTIATLAMGLLAGFAVLSIQSWGFLSEPLKQQVSGGCGGCKPKFNANAAITVAWKFWPNPERRDAFWQEIRSVGWFLGKWLTLAFMLESLMVAYIPAEWIGTLAGSDRWYAIPLATLIGIPSYLNGYAAIPLVSGLIDMGMSPGAAMAFITSGAVSSIPAALAVYALVKKSVFVLYIVLGLLGSMLAGYAFQLSGGVI